MFIAYEASQKKYMLEVVCVFALHSLANAIVLRSPSV